MSTTATPTKEDLDKRAAVITNRKHQGFIAHIQAVGRTEEQIAKDFPKYASQDAARTQKWDDLEQAIVAPIVAGKK